LKETAVSDLQTALSTAVTSSGCAQCTAVITKITDASSKVVYPSSRRLETLLNVARSLAGALTVDYTVTGSNADAVAAVTTSAPATFSTTLSTKIAQVNPLFSGVTATVIASSTTAAAATSNTAAAIGGGVGGGIAFILIVAVAIWYFSKKSVAAKNSALTKPSSHHGGAHV